MTTPERSVRSVRFPAAYGAPGGPESLLDLRPSLERSRGDHPRRHRRIRHGAFTFPRRAIRGCFQGEIPAALLRKCGAIPAVLGAPAHHGPCLDPRGLPTRRDSLALPHAM